MWYKTPLPLIARWGDRDAVGGLEASKGFNTLEEGRFLKTNPRRQSTGRVPGTRVIGRPSAVHFWLVSNRVPREKSA